jgi:hypothetical protein
VVAESSAQADEANEGEDSVEAEEEEDMRAGTQEDSQEI